MNSIAGLAFINLSDAQRLFRKGEKVTGMQTRRDGHLQRVGNCAGSSKYPGG